MCLIVGRLVDTAISRVLSRTFQTKFRNRGSRGGVTTRGRGIQRDGGEPEICRRICPDRALEGVHDSHLIPF
jgi:hypothetical protein